MREFSIRFDFERPEQATENQLRAIGDAAVKAMESAAVGLSLYGVYLRRATIYQNGVEVGRA